MSDWGHHDPEGGCLILMVLAAAAIVLGVLGLAVLVGLGVDHALRGAWDGWTP